MVSPGATSTKYLTSAHVHSLYTQNSPLFHLDCKTCNTNAEKPKFNPTTVVYFTLADIFGNQESPRGEVEGLSLVHFDLFFFSLF